MRIGTRLVLALGIAVSIVMAAYAFIALRQREALLAEAFVRETETLGRTLQITVNNALRDGRLADLDRVLGRVAEDPETYAALLLGENGRLVAGGPAEAVTCLDDFGPMVEQVGDVRGWADCGGRVRWVGLPSRDTGSVLIVARRATVLELDLVRSRRRMAITTLALAMAAALAILGVLRRTLTAPLVEVMRGVRGLGGPLPQGPVAVPSSAGEIAELAVAFNEMAERLEGKRRSLLKETEERIALERRLRRSEKFAALGRLSGGLAHEIGSPLNVIGVRAEAMASQPADAAAVRRHAEEILHEIDRIGQLVRKLSQVAGRHSEEPVAVNLSGMVRAVADEVADQARAVGAAVEVHIAQGPAVVTGDATLLRHALLNLVLNALHSLREAPGERTVQIRLWPSDSSVCLTVDDTGPGIASSDLPRIFEPFFTTREVGEGMGLGLAISLGIIEDHGGELHLENRPGGGARAMVTLPAPPTTIEEGA